MDPDARRQRAMHRMAKRAAALEVKKERAEELKEEGNEHFKQGRWKKASKSYEEAIKTYGPRVIYLNNLAVTYLKLQRYHDAALCAEDVLARDPKHPKARFLRAMARKGRGELLEAAADLTVLLHADPTCTDAQRELEALHATLEDSDSSPSSLTYAALKPLAAPLPAAAPPAGECDTPWLSESSDFAHRGDGRPCWHYNHGGCMHGAACARKHAPDALSVRDSSGRNVCLAHLLGVCAREHCYYSHHAARLPRGPWAAPAWRTRWRDALQGEGTDGRALARLAPVIKATAGVPTTPAQLLPSGRYRALERVGRRWAAAAEREDAGEGEVEDGGGVEGKDNGAKVQDCDGDSSTAERAEMDDRSDSALR